MNSLSKISSVGLPSLIGIGIAWIGIRILSRERELAERKIELEIQLNARTSINK